MRPGSAIHGIRRLVWVLLLLPLVAACQGGDPLDDDTYPNTVINIRQLSEIRAQLKPGYSVDVGLKNWESIRLVVKELTGTALVGQANETLLWQDIESVRFVSESDRTVSARLQQLVVVFFAFLIAGIMGAAALLAWIIEAIRNLF